MKLLEPWHNVDSQVTLLEFSLMLQDSDLINFEHTPNRQARMDAVQGMKPVGMNLLSTWCRIKLVERLIDRKSVG